MKKLNALFIAAVMALSFSFFAAQPASAQIVPTTKKVVKKSYRTGKKGTKSAYRHGKRAAKASYRGGRWVTIRVYRGGKWVTRKVWRGGKRVVMGKKSRHP
jgi:hypothetical protein